MLENCRALLYMSRFYGCHPHTIREESTTKTTAKTRFHPLMLYSVVMCSVYCVAAYYARNIIECVPEGAMIVGCAIQEVNRYSYNFYMILTTVLSCLQHRHFEHAVETARKFDNMVQHYRRRIANDKPVNEPRRFAQWLTLLGLYVAWIVSAGYTIYVVREKIPWFLILLLTAIRIAFAVQVAKFCFLYDTLRRRFRLINQLCSESPDIVNPPTVRRVAVATRKDHRQSERTGENGVFHGKFHIRTRRILYRSDRIGSVSSNAPIMHQSL